MKEKRELLMSYIKVNIAPILVDFITGKDLEGAIILPSNISNEELNGHYINDIYKPPKWLDKMIFSNKQSILVIDNIDSINKEEQEKFIEILKYKKVSTFNIPKTTIVIVTAKVINKDKINEKIYSLVAQI